MQFEEKRKEKEIKNRLSINRIKDQNQKIDQLSRIATMQNTESNSFQKLASLKKLFFACNSKRKEKKNKLKIDRSLINRIKDQNQKIDQLPRIARAQNTLRRVTLFRNLLP